MTPSKSDKLLFKAMEFFLAKLNERQFVKLQGMEDYLHVPDYQRLAQFEQQMCEMECEAMTNVLSSRSAYLRAQKELHNLEIAYLTAIENGIQALNERNRIAKDINTKMRKGDYTDLRTQNQSTDVDEREENEVNAKEVVRITEKVDQMSFDSISRPQRPNLLSSSIKNSSLPPPPQTLDRIRKKLNSISVDTPMRPVLQAINPNKTLEQHESPKVGILLSSQGSLDGSVVPNRIPSTPIMHMKISKPNFDDTMDEPQYHFMSQPKSSDPLPTVSDASSTFTLPTPTTSSISHTMVPPLSTSTLSYPIPSTSTTKTIKTTVPSPLSTMGIAGLRRPQLKSEIGRSVLGPNGF